MLRLDLFPKQILEVAIQQETPISWAEPANVHRKKAHGAFCSMCPGRASKRVDEDGWPTEVSKPLVIRATDKKDQRRMLVVVDNTSYSSSVTRTVKYIREAGFTGQIVVEMAARCGGGKIDKVDDSAIRACRPHIAFTFNLLKPTHILLCGTRATKAFLGETVMVQKNRMTWQMVETEYGRVPAVCTVSPVDATGNYVFRRCFKQEVGFLVHYDWSQAPKLNGVVRVVENERDALKLRDWVNEGNYVSFDFETTGKLFKGIQAICIGFARHDSHITWAVHPSAMDDAGVVDILRGIMVDPAIMKVGQNVKYDMHVAEQVWGVVPTPVDGCTRLMLKTLNAEADADLEAIGMLVGIGSHKSEAKEELKRIVHELRMKFFEKHGRKPKSKHEYEPLSEAYGLIDMDILLRYCALDTYTTAVAYVHFKRLLKEHEYLGRTYKKRVAKANLTFRRIEKNGLLVSESNIDMAASFIRKEIKKSLDSIQAYKFPPHAPKELRGRPIDPDKPQSIREFFEIEELSVPFVTEKSGLASTNKKALKLMRNQHTIISHIIDYRATTKLMSSYIETLPFFICDDGRVHPNILLDGARSGRMSCIEGSQRIYTDHGWVRFDSLAALLREKSEVRTLTHNGRWQRVTACWSNGLRRTVRVTGADGREIRVTPDHQLRSDTEWVQAGHTAGSRLQAGIRPGVVAQPCTQTPLRCVGGNLARELHHPLGGERRCHSLASVAVEVAKVEDAGVCEVFDFTVEEDHSALVEGFFAHNCTAPGMQTIPSGDTEMAKMVKSCFVAPPGRTLISIDYKTLEIYIAALWSMDRAMIDILLSGADFHIETAKRISRYAWAMGPEEIEELIKRDLADSTKGNSSVHRSMAKKATFSTIYGMGHKTLAGDINAPERMAKDIITGLFTEYFGLRNKLDESVSYVRKFGEVVIPWNHKPSRRRPLPYIGYNDFMRRGNAERAAGNTPIQGWAADFCTEAAIALDEIFENDFNGRAQVDLTIHDALLIEADDAYVDEVAAVANEVMCSFPSAPLRLKTDTKVGKTWGSMKDHKPKSMRRIAA